MIDLCEQPGPKTGALCTETEGHGGDHVAQGLDPTSVRKDGELLYNPKNTYVIEQWPNVS